MTALRLALVTRADGSLLWVDLFGEEVPCRLPLAMRRRGLGPGPGDEVVVQRGADGRYDYRGIAARRRVQLVVVVEAARLGDGAKPALPGRPIREVSETLVVVNKCDLTDELTLRSLVAGLVENGTQVVLTSATDGRGVGELRSRLEGKLSVLTGWPRSGKSSLVQAMYPGYPVAWAAARGTHSRLEYSPLPGGGYLAV